MQLNTKLSEEDAAEIEKFKLYLAAVNRWNDSNNEPIRPGLMSDAEMARHILKRTKAQRDIYDQFYGPIP